MQHRIGEEKTMNVWQYAGKEVCCMIVLLRLALEDKKHCEIERRTLLLTGALLGLAGFFSSVGWEFRVAGAAFGSIVLLFCLFSEEALGLGDGIFICILAVAYGVGEAVTACFFATAYAALISSVLLLTRKAGRKTKIPFMPFMLLGYVTSVMMKYIR